MSFVILGATDKTGLFGLRVVESCLAMSYQPHTEKLTRLSAHLEDLFARLSGHDQSVITPELADEIAATAGEVMVELAGHSGDELARQVIEDARRVRESVRTARPEPTRVSASGQALISDLDVVIREEKRAA